MSVLGDMAESSDKAASDKALRESLTWTKEVDELNWLRNIVRDEAGTELGSARGVIQQFGSKDTMHLDYLFVNDRLRGTGVGLETLRGFAEESRNMGARHMTAQVTNPAMMRNQVKLFGKGNMEISDGLGGWAPFADEEIGATRVNLQGWTPEPKTPVLDNFTTVYHGTKDPWPGDKPPLKQPKNINGRVDGPGLYTADNLETTAHYAKGGPVYETRVDSSRFFDLTADEVPDDLQPIFKKVKSSQYSGSRRRHFKFQDQFAEGLEARGYAGVKRTYDWGKNDTDFVLFRPQDHEFRRAGAAASSVADAPIGELPTPKAPPPLPPAPIPKAVVKEEAEVVAKTVAKKRLGLKGAKKLGMGGAIIIAGLLATSARSGVDNAAGAAARVSRPPARTVSYASSAQQIKPVRQMRGSMEGLVKQKTTMIERAGTGYSNTAQMGKRYSGNTLKNTNINYGIMGNSNMSAMNMSNTTFMGTKGSSVQRLNR